MRSSGHRLTSQDICIFFGLKSDRLQRIWMQLGGKATPGHPASVLGGSEGDSGVVSADSCPPFPPKRSGTLIRQ